MISGKTPEFDLVMRDEQFIIYNGADPFLTPGGNVFAHSGERFIKYLLADMTNGGLERDFGATSIFIHQCDRPGQGEWLTTLNLEQLLAGDLYVGVKCGRASIGSHASQQFDAQDTIDANLLNFRLWTYSSILNRIHEFLSDHLVRLEGDAEDQPFTNLLKVVLMGLGVPEKACLDMLSQHHGSGIVLPLLLVMGNITPSEYFRALQAQDKEVPERFFKEAYVVLDYLMIMRSSAGPVVRYQSLIRSGESDRLEFKSTLRWDLKAGKTNQAVERASLKTISAFLNAQGGTLLIGIRDDGSVEGIESDRFPNEDKFLLHLWTLIRTCFGRDVSPFIQTSLEEASGKTICAVRCNRSPRPVFLRQPGFNEEFYIRLGPASVALDVSEALKYIHTHFPEHGV